MQPRSAKRKRARVPSDWIVHEHSAFPDWKMPLPRVNLIRMLEMRDKDIEFEEEKGFRRKSSASWYEGLTKLISKLFCGDPTVFASDVLSSEKRKKRKKKGKTGRFADVDPELMVSIQEREDEITEQIILDACSSGREQGLFVDRQLTAIVNNVPIPLCRRKFEYAKECREFWTAECEHVRIGGAALMKHIHPFTILVISELLDRRLVPVVAQLPVFHDEHNVASAVDQVWWDPRKHKWVIVEIKCEKKANFTAVSIHPPLAPFQDFPNTSRLRAMIQLALTASMAQRCYPVIDSPSCLLVRIHTQGPVEVEELDRAVASRVAHMWEQWSLVL